MKKVLFITKSQMFGGVEKVLIDIVNLLDPLKYQITVMTEEQNTEVKKNLPSHVEYKSIFKKRFRGLDRVLVHFPPFLLHKMFINNFYDIEVSFQEGFPTKLVAGSNGKTKKISWFHNDPYYYDFNLPYFREKKNLKKYVNKFDRLVTVSNVVSNNYKKYINFDKELKVIYNPIDTALIKKLSKETVTDLENNESIFRICFIGRLSEEKQVGMLIDSVVRLHTDYSNIELIIVGDGHQFSDIENKISNSHANGFIKLLGYKDNPYPYIYKSSLLICCSKTESFCLVVAESLLLGTPVLSTKCGGPEEILENGKYGMLVDNDSESLLKGIEKMLKDKGLYFSYRNKGYTILNKFDKNIIRKEIEEVLKEEENEKDCAI
ncbi:glycosyltransferase [Sediminibacillus massiliensis]|uniref:glycosyltransferase n=1 Tax=Sediminibacillus massiliensis TaxID=1926277 RepID=UPI0009886B76|nr:glycosyltransferase [Sediminibacillus massiliensis]